MVRIVIRGSMNGGVCFHYFMKWKNVGCCALLTKCNYFAYAMFFFQGLSSNLLKAGTIIHGLTPEQLWTRGFYLTDQLCPTICQVCVVYTDHAACLSILNTAKQSGKLARWALTIEELDFTIKLKSGKNNADALPCCPADELPC